MSNVISIVKRSLPIAARIWADVNGEFNVKEFMRRVVMGGAVYPAGETAGDM